MPLERYTGKDVRVGQMVQIKGTFLRYDSDTERVSDVHKRQTKSRNLLYSNHRGAVRALHTEVMDSYGPRDKDVLPALE